MSWSALVQPPCRSGFRPFISAEVWMCAPEHDPGSAKAPSCAGPRGILGRGLRRHAAARPHAGGIGGFRACAAGRRDGAHAGTSASDLQPVRPFETVRPSPLSGEDVPARQGRKARHIRERHRRSVRRYRRRREAHALPLCDRTGSRETRADGNGRTRMGRSPGTERIHAATNVDPAAGDR